MDDETKEKIEGWCIYLIFMGMLIFIAFSLANHATDGILFAEPLECQDTEYKMITELNMAHTQWEIQPDGTYAICGPFNNESLPGDT